MDNKHLEDTNQLKSIRDSLWKGSEPVNASWERLLNAIKREVALIKEEQSKGNSVVPQVPYFSFSIINHHPFHYR